MIRRRAHTKTTQMLVLITAGPSPPATGPVAQPRHTATLRIANGPDCQSVPGPVRGDRVT